MKKIIKGIFAFFNIAIRSKSKLEKKLANSISLEKLNLGVRVEFQSEERTLTTQEVDQQMKQLIENLKQDFNVEI